MTYTRDTATIGYESMTAIAQAYVSTEPDAPVLKCDSCGQECDTHESAHTDAMQSIREFLNHTAFDHASRASILEYRLARVVSWA